MPFLSSLSFQINISHAPNTAIFRKVAPPLWMRVQGLCSIDAYQLFQELTGPVKPASKIFAELVTRWTTIKTWKVIQWQIFFHFYPWNRRTDKSVSIFISELQLLLQYCVYGEETLDEMVCDHLVCGINHGRRPLALVFW